jgi:hypothetical protein
MNYEQRKRFSAQQKELKAKIAFSNSYQAPEPPPPPIEEPPEVGEEQNPEHQPSNRFPKQTTF